MEKKKLSKGALIAIIALFTVAVVFGGIYTEKHKGTEGSKAYTIEIVSIEGDTTSIEASTDQEYLQGAMDELVADGKLTYDGVDQSAGYMVQEINGERAVYEEDNFHLCNGPQGLSDYARICNH